MNTAVNEFQAAAVPETITHSETFYFRTFKDTPENRAKLPKDPDHQIELDLGKDETGVATFKRKAETYTYDVPNAKALLSPTATEQEVVVMQDVINTFMKTSAKALVEAGKTITSAVLNWESIVASKFISLTTGGSSTGSGISAAMLRAFSEKFATWATAQGHKPAGIELTGKMIRGRFGATTAGAYKPVVPRVVENIGLFFTDGMDETEQAANESILEYLIAQAEKALEEPKVEDMESMFD